MNTKKNKEEVVNKVAIEIEALLIRRIRKLEKEISSFLNINPFLMSALRDIHELKNLDDLANFLFISHMASGHATSFGKTIDEKILPNVFGTIKLDSVQRRKRKMNSSAYNEIDHIVNPHSDTDWCLLSVKAGPWTIQDASAHSLYSAFKQIGDFNLYGKEIVVGVFYGNESSLTNKYEILRGINPRQQSQFVVLDYVRVLAGKDFWSWLNGGEERTQEWVLEGTQVGSSKVLSSNEDVAKIVRNAPERLKYELQEKYDLDFDSEIDWLKILFAINN
ncbi:MAG: restriction endonuclease [Bacteroidetes bacterium]|jgi:hypothetical protein|nr:restriction endonuclease [Bacteroidota bacterium]